MGTGVHPIGFEAGIFAVEFFGEDQFVLQNTGPVYGDAVIRSSSFGEREMVSPAVFAGLHGCGIGTGEEHRGGGKDSVKEAMPAIANVMVIGDKRKFLTALLCLQVEIDAELLGDRRPFLQDGMTATIRYYGDEALAVTLPMRDIYEL